MSTKVLDISYWQGNVDFKKIKSAGYSYIILRAGYGTTIDSNFYSYAKSCVNNGIKIGIYWFCYSTSSSEVKSEAAKCIETIKAYPIDLPVFFDFEYDTVNKAKKKGISLSKNECSKFTITFCEEMKKAGYTPGYYANLDYYKNMYTDEVKQKGYVFWLAHYTANKAYHKPPVSCDFFQYSDAGKVPGIGGSSVDLDVCLNGKYLDCRNMKEGEKTMSKTDAINAMITIAENEVGYLEKKSNSQLDSKIQNSGFNNITKYWRDVKPDFQASPWCACYVSWVFMKAFGLETAKKLLKHWPYVYCPTLGSLFTKHANPQVGDIVIFWRGGTFAHTGIVTKVQGDKFWTVEGNASSASGITPNGGAVVKKSYYNSNLLGTKFCRPDYSIVTKTNSVTPVAPTPNPKTYLELGDTGAEVKELQKKLNQLGYKGKDGKKLEEDSSFGQNTAFAVRAFQKDHKLVVDGKAGKNTMTALNAAVESITKPQTPSNGWVGEVTASELNVRSWAGTEYPIIKSYPKLSKGNRIRVLSNLKASDGSTWYKIVINNAITKNQDVIGFVAAKYIKKV